MQDFVFSSFFKAEIFQTKRCASFSLAYQMSKTTTPTLYASGNLSRGSSSSCDDMFDNVSTTGDGGGRECASPSSSSSISSSFAFQPRRGDPTPSIGLLIHEEKPETRQRCHSIPTTPPILSTTSSAAAAAATATAINSSSTSSSPKSSSSSQPSSAFQQLAFANIMGQVCNFRNLIYTPPL